MKWHVIIASLWCSLVVALGQTNQSAQTTLTTLGIGGAVAYHTAAGQADLAVSKSLLNANILKGEVGEAIRDQTVGRYLHQSGKWLNASPRIGRQGLDHVSVQLNENGTPRHLMVDETKYGSSTLLTTKAGDIQMGKKWISDRLRYLAGYYDNVAEVARKGVPLSKLPKGISPKQVISIPLNDSESVVFWHSGSEWNYDGPSESLPRAIRQLNNLARFYRAGAEGRIDFRKRIFHVKLDDDIMKLTIRDASNVDGLKGDLAQMPVEYKRALPIEKATWASAAMREKIAADIKAQNPRLDDAEAMRQAKGIQTIAKSAEAALISDSFPMFSMKQAAQSGALGIVIIVPIDLAFQLIGDGSVNWSRVAGTAGLAGGSAVVGSLAGNGVTYVLLRTGAATEAASILGLNSAGRFASGAGGAVGGGVAIMLFAYGGYWMGYYDLKTANRSAFAGGTGTIVASYAAPKVASSVWATIVALDAAEAEVTAEEGPPGWVVGGIAIVITTAVGAPILHAFHLYDEHQDNIRLSKTMDYLAQKQTFFLPDHKLP